MTQFENTLVEKTHFKAGYHRG